VTRILDFIIKIALGIIFALLVIISFGILAFLVILFFKIHLLLGLSFIIITLIFAYAFHRGIL